MMRKKIRIILIITIFLMIFLVTNVNAVSGQTICTAVLKAFELYGTEVQGSINVTNSEFEYNETTEKYDVTLNITTEQIADDAELSVQVEGYTLENEVMQEGLSYTVNGNTVNSNVATLSISIDKPSQAFRKAKVTISGNNTEGSLLETSTEVKFILIPAITLGDVVLQSDNMPDNVIQIITLPVVTEDIEKDEILDVKLIQDGVDIDTSKYTVTGTTVDSEGAALIKISAGPEITLGTYNVVVSYKTEAMAEKLEVQKEFIITNIEINKIVINQQAISMEVGEATIITYSIVPSIFTDEDLIFSSEDENVATISKGGRIVAVGRGQTNVKISSKDGKVESGVQVTVFNPAVEITQISTNPDTLMQGEEGTIHVKIATQDLENGKSLDVSVQKHDIDVTYLFTIEGNAIQNNEVNLTLTPNKEQTKSGEYTVVVTFDGKQIESENLEKQTAKFNIEGTNPITGIEVDKSNIRMTVNSTSQITATITPDEAQNKKIIWESNNEEIATVDENGLVTAVGKGKAIITVYSDENQEIKQTINIIEQEILETEEYTIDLENKIIKFIPENTNVTAFLENVQIGSETYTLTNKAGDTITGESLVGTDTILKINSEEFKIVVIGDINGDGKISITDLSKLKLHLVEKELLTDGSLLAADMNKDEQSTLTDLSKMKQYIVGM